MYHLYTNHPIFGFKIQNVPPLKTNMSPENRWLEDVFSLLKYSSPFLGDMLVFRGVVFKGGVSLKISSIHQIWSHHYVPLQSFVHGQPVQPGCLRGFLGDVRTNFLFWSVGWMYLRSTLHTDSSIFSIMMIAIHDVNNV